MTVKRTVTQLTLEAGIQKRGQDAADTSITGTEVTSADVRPATVAVSLEKQGATRDRPAPVRGQRVKKQATSPGTIRPHPGRLQATHVEKSGGRRAPLWPPADTNSVPDMTMTAAGSYHPGNIEAGMSSPLFTPEGGSAASTASPSPRRTRRARMRFKEHGDGGVTCDVVNCKRAPVIHVRDAGWLCDEHHGKWLDQGDQDWREAHAKVQ